MTLTALGERIPDYHQPTDNFDRIDPAVLADALEAGRELIRAIDRGEAD
jgi:aminopeptidase-like protein